MAQIYEYKMHASQEGLRCPDFIDNGGYWKNPDDSSYLGVNPDVVEYYVPDTVTAFTLAEAKTRQLAIHAKYPMRDHEGDSDMSDAEVEEKIDNWWSGVQ